jgi:hypothetical protein
MNYIETYSDPRVEVEVTDLNGGYVCYDNTTTVVVRILATNVLTNVHQSRILTDAS